MKYRVALALNAVAKRLHSAPAALRTALRLAVPYTAVTAAGVANVGLMRVSQIDIGLCLFNHGNYTLTFCNIGSMDSKMSLFVEFLCTIKLVKNLDIRRLLENML